MSDREKGDKETLQDFISTDKLGFLGFKGLFIIDLSVLIFLGQEKN
tara:strand:+ start:954 stop:1091 length:138 start_codon:yes stop_codon:yes gene_type:complete